ncbi:MAG: HAD family hydrolase [Candidatus Eisenbacteria bacterium]|uniref:HAD family hydrolase n=1 Tax=Eiseniibacteriota bacterium TaxID=2212470 RepID=A0A956N877_UNCEI|nr:HAD family hydrolase [Candidatus Eisenbacteria bacterium]MCB9463172.1 HAD family hydrolase [Candidatus Eisenbacteria bacterium]
MIRWVFLDMGNVVMNDDPVMTYLYELLHDELQREGRKVSFEQLMADREEIIAERGTGHWSILTERILGKERHETLARTSAEHLRANYLQYHNVLPGMADALQQLSEEFSLGIVANQMSVAEDALREVGLAHHFRFIALSERVGAAKPDPTIFHWALAQAQCQPEEAIMVGDRIDTDIVPARRLGLWTLWFHADPRCKGWDPSGPRAHAYRESQLRASTSSVGPTGKSEEPDGRAVNADELVSEIRRICSISE